jgi:hypothetical protein
MEAQRPEYMKFIGLWGYTNEGKWNFVQVFEVEEKSKVPDALERNESVFFQTYGDIPGFAYTHRIAYTPQRGFQNHRSRMNWSPQKVPI